MSAHICGPDPEAGALAAAVAKLEEIRNEALEDMEKLSSLSPLAARMAGFIAGLDRALAVVQKQGRLSTYPAGYETRGKEEGEA